jgi:SAM-dependent methyltransferase
MSLQDTLLSLPRRLESRLRRLMVESLVLRRRGHLGTRIDDIMRLDEAAVGALPAEAEEEERALPGFRGLKRRGHHRYMLGRYLSVLPLVKGKRVLEVGSGLGWGSYLIQDAPRDLVCLDASRSALDFARATWSYGPHVRLVEGVAADLDALGETPFDVVLAFELIEHLGVDAARRFLEQARRCLIPGGFLVLTSYFPSRAFYARREERKNRHHLHVFLREEIADEVRRAGFDRVEVRGTFLCIARSARR